MVGEFCIEFNQFDCNVYMYTKYGTLSVRHPVYLYVCVYFDFFHS